MADRNIGQRIPTLGLPGFEDDARVAQLRHVVDDDAVYAPHGPRQGAPRSSYMHQPTQMRGQIESDSAALSYSTNCVSVGLDVCPDFVKPQLYSHVKPYQEEVTYKRGPSPNVLTIADEDDTQLAGSRLSTGSSIFDDEAYGSINTNSFDIFMQDCDGDTSLHLAIIDRDVALALRFIQSADDISDLDIVNKLGQTALHLAAYLDLPNVVHLLIVHQVGLELRDRNGNTALHLACREGHEEVVRLLVDASPRAAALYNYHGLTCVHLAAEKSFTSIVQLLVQCRAVSIDEGDGCGGLTVLHRAIKAGDGALAHFLIVACAADINATARDGQTPLTMATDRRLWNTVRMLSERGAHAQEHSSDDGFASDDEDGMDYDEVDLSKNVRGLNLNSDDEDLYG